jgi:tRNA (adenine37-N6)-methyltransferase
MGKIEQQTERSLESIQLRPIGIVRNQSRATVLAPEMQALPWQDRAVRMKAQRQSVSEIVINPEFEEMLDGVDEFSHILVLFWSHLAPEGKCLEAKVYPMGNREFPKVGIFATHSPARPNGILVTEVCLLERRDNVLMVTGLDALDGSPVLDIKSHVPVLSAEEIKTPDWHKTMRGVFAKS